LRGSHDGRNIENMKSSQESRIKSGHEIQPSDAAGIVQLAGSESQANTTSLTQAESLLATEKRTLEMMAKGASLSEPHALYHHALEPPGIPLSFLHSPSSPGQCAHRECANSRGHSSCSQFLA
jgi:hypothetical protein